jgi:hypothetical protein
MNAERRRVSIFTPHSKLGATLAFSIFARPTARIVRQIVHVAEPEGSRPLRPRLDHPALSLDQQPLQMLLSILLSCC